jgi:hypothetical protein
VIGAPILRRAARSGFAAYGGVISAAGVLLVGGLALSGDASRPATGACG